MDLKYIKELIQLLEKSSIQRLVIKEKNGVEITLDKGDTKQVHVVEQTFAPKSAYHPLPPAPDSHPVQSIQAENKESSESSPIDPKKCVTSPMVGTFYAAESPDSKPFVSVGDHVKKGDTLCIIEAMKVMNEVKSDRSGKVVKILIEDGSPVEYGQALFVIES